MDFGPLTFKEIESVRTVLDVINCAVTHRQAILVKGPVGCGKTAILQHVAARHGRFSAPHFLTVQIGEHMDGRTLVGTHECSDVPGEFDWVPGHLTTAFSTGHWLLLEDLDNASVDLLSSLVAALKNRTLNLPDGTLLHAHEDFRLFATIRTGNYKTASHMQNSLNEWFSIDMEPLNNGDMKEILTFLFPKLSANVERLLETFDLLSKNSHASGSRPMCFRDLVKLFRRISKFCASNDPVIVFQEAVDCLAAYIRRNRLDVMNLLGTNLNITKEKVEYYYSCHKPPFEISNGRMRIGRADLKLAKIDRLRRCRNFAQTRPSLVLLEQISICVEMDEPVLLVGETGCGKTMTIQVLADCLGKNLHVVNMSQQSENADLLGGYKPVDLSYAMKRLKERYIDLFARTFSLAKNEKFLRHIRVCFETSSWETLVALMKNTTENTLKKSKSRKNENFGKWLKFHDDLAKMRRILAKSKGGMLFSFVEGILTKAVKNGEWILLDEINLASPETLDCLNTVLDNQSKNIALSLQKNYELSVSSNFRLFACMNPSTDVGKRELLPGIRNRFTEIFVDECSNPEDLSLLVDDYLRGVPLSGDPSKRSDKIMNIVRFYLTVKTVASSKLAADSWGHFPTFSLRTLCRALHYVKNNVDNGGNITRVLYEGFCMSFLTELDLQSYAVVKKMIEEFIIGRNPSLVKTVLSSPLPAPTKGHFVNVQGYWLQKGSENVTTDEKYILTQAVERNLADVARAVSAQLHPVLLQGETSVGKTSLIKFLAKLTGNKCVRINNHEHTDLQEYLGTYLSDRDGKLNFVEGPLVQAMKGGHWIILDELNLAPPDVLEALNRVLDDNRELFVTETQEVVKAHPNFMLFATQNPHGLYGGRKQLSRAFRNRFVELHFDELPHNQLQRILHLRCHLPLSYAKKMVKSMQDLQMFRSSSGLFAGRESYMTLRDLFRWGERYRLANIAQVSNTQFYDWDQYLADQGYFLLASRCRRQDDHETVCDVLQKSFGRQIDHKALFAFDSPYLPFKGDEFKNDFSHVVYTYNFRRLAVLTSQSILYDEPVLLVGDTGCGKTTLCQMLASHKNKLLHMINCHMMTEASDFVGRIAPTSTDKMAQGILFEWSDGPLVLAMRNGEPILIDEISLADDSVLERLNSVLEPEKTLLLSEMGGAHKQEGGVAKDFLESCQQITGRPGFVVLATMNPGGDYGKKELSKALRNRFTEIWCDCEYEKSDIVAIVQRSLSFNSTQLADQSSLIGELIFDFAAWLKNYSFENSKLVVTIRDILSWVTFMNRCSNILSPALAYIHGAFSTFLDGYGCGTNRTVALQNRQKLLDDSLNCLKLFASKIEPETLHENLVCHISDSGLKWTENGLFGAEPFFITCDGPPESVQNYCFDAPTCALNIFKILRALLVDKPILLEGSPGVGKTSVVQALAKSTGRTLVRINLSEQTDLCDLFGTDAPVTLADGQQGFSWVDGPLLSAVKNGHWILIDEMNLASQSVLEGLNACFDHRKKIFVPQLGKSFHVDSSTKFFACQNPFSEGASRKGLPKSFLNRFTMVFIEQLESRDVFFILSQAFPSLKSDIIEKMVDFNLKYFVNGAERTSINDEVNVQRKWGHLGGPWEFNLRDLMRWCSMTIEMGRLPVDVFNIIYVDRLRCSTDKRKMIECFEECFDTTYKHPSLDFCASDDIFSVGTSVLQVDRPENSTENCVTGGFFSLVLLRSALNPMRSVMQCVRSNFLTILVGEPGSGKSALIESLAKICGKTLRTLCLTSETDSSDLLGCYEQTFLTGSNENSRRTIEESWRKLRTDLILTCYVEKKFEFIDQIFELMPLDLDEIDAKVLLKISSQIWSIASSLAGSEFLERVIEIKSATEKFCCAPFDQIEEKDRKSFQFTWVDSPLVEALRDGDWLIIKNVHFCNPAVLDRLNALLEPNGELSVAEKGSIDGKAVAYKPHENFRIFFTMQPGHGKSISRAMRNRGVEIYMSRDESWFNDRQDCFSVLKNKLKIDEALFECLWLALKSFGDAGSTASAPDFIKAAFIAKEFQAKFGLPMDAVQFAFKIVLRKVDCNAINRPPSVVRPLRPYLTVDRVRKNRNFLSLHREVSLLEVLIKENADSDTLLDFMKFFLLGSTPGDYKRRLKVVQKFSPDQKTETVKKLAGVIKKLGDHLRPNLPLDPRWSAYLHQHSGSTDSSCGNSRWNMASLCIFFNFIDACLCTTSATHNSLLKSAKESVEGKLNPDALPCKSFVFIPGFFEHFKSIVENCMASENPWFTDNWITIVRGLFLLPRFYDLCTREISSLRQFWSKNSVEIRIVWQMLVKSFDSVFQLSQVCSQIAEQLSGRWCVESALCKAYKNEVKHLEMAKPYASLEDCQDYGKMRQLLEDSNKSLRSAFDEDDEKLVERLMIGRQDLLRKIEDYCDLTPVGQITELDVEMECPNTVALVKNPFVPLRKDILGDYANLWSAFIRFYETTAKISEFPAKHFNIYGQIDVKMLHRANSYESKIVEISSAENLHNFVGYLNRTTGLNKLNNDAMCSFKIGNLLDVPAVATIFGRFFSGNFASIDHCVVPLSKIDQFKENIDFFVSFLWRIGPVLPSLDQIIRLEILRSVDHLQECLKWKVQGNCSSILPEQIFSIVEHFGMEICSRLAPPKNFMDPVLKSKAKTDLYNGQLAQVERELNFLDFRYKSFTNKPLLNGRDFDVPVESLHPYVEAMLAVKNDVVAKLSSTATVSYYRPESSQFEGLIEELHSFQSTIQAFVKSIDQNSSSSDQLKSMVRKMQNFLTSADHFVESVLKNRYFAYVDITEPFLLGVDLLRLVFSRQLVSNFRAIKRQELAQDGYLDVETLIHLHSKLMDLENGRGLELLTDQTVDAFAPKDQLRILRLAFETTDSDQKTVANIKPYCEKIVNLHAFWVASQEKDDKYYKYKSKEPTSVEEQENLHIAALFPNYGDEIFDEKSDVIIDVDEDSESFTKPKEIFEEKLDENCFVSTLKVVLFEKSMGHRANAMNGQAILYQLAGKIFSDHWIAVDPGWDLDHLDEHILAADNLRNFFSLNHQNREKLAKNFNVYNSADLVESGRLKTLVDGLKLRICQLLTDWPENAVLEQILKSCDKVLNLPVQTPVIKLIGALEFLLDEANEWEKVAARHVKLDETTQPMRHLLIDWRKMEIRGWERLLDDVEEEFLGNALSTVLKFSAVLQSFLSGSIDEKEFMMAYTNFLAFCPMGEFTGRLDASKSINFALLDGKPQIRAFCDNINRYFACFSEKISHRILANRQPVERELKDFIKIVKFQDLNVYRAKETGRHAHRQLFKLVRKYKESLEEPVSSSLNDVVPLNDQLKSFLNEVMQRTDSQWPRKIFDPAISQIGTKFSGYFSKFENFVQKSCECIDADAELVEICSDTASMARDFSSNLRKPLNYVNSIDKKSDNEKLYKRSMQMRRNLLTDLFKCLQQNGVRHRSGLSVDKNHFDDLVFKFLQPEMLANDCQALKQLDQLFWLGVQRKNLLDDRSGQKPHDQLDHVTFERCKGYAQALATILVEVRSDLASSLQQSQRLQENVALLDVLCQNCEFSNFYTVQEDINGFLGKFEDFSLKLQQNFAKSLNVWQCNRNAMQKDNFGLNVGSDFSPKLSFLNENDETFEIHFKQLQNLHEKSEFAWKVCKMLKTCAENNSGFLVGESLQDLIPLTTFSNELRPSLESVIKICSTSACQSNLFNKNLLKNLHLLTEFGAHNFDVESFAYNSTFTPVDSGLSEPLIEKVYFKVQQIYKSCEQQATSEEDSSLVNELKKYRQFKQFVDCQQIFHMVAELSVKYRASCCKVDPLAVAVLKRFSMLHRSILKRFEIFSASLSNLYLEILDGWILLLREGFVKPAPELDDGQNKEQPGGRDSKFEDLKDAGMGEGQGAQDVSDQIEELGQIEGLKGQEENGPQESKMDDVEKPIEMDDDFDAQMEDLQLDEEDNEKSDDEGGKSDEGEEEPDWQKGEAEEPQEDQLDPKLWDDNEKQDEAQEEPNLDEKATGAEDVQDELAAKDEEKAPKSNDDENLSDAKFDEKEAESVEEAEEADMENIDTQEDKPDGQESDSDDQGNEICEPEKVDENEAEKKDDLDQSSIEPYIPDQSQINESKSISQFGSGGSARDQNVDVNQQQTLDKSFDQQPVDEIEELKKDQHNEDRTSNENQLESTKGGSFNERYSNKRNNIEPDVGLDKKRQKVDEKNKTLADAEMSAKELSKKVDFVENDGSAADKENQPSENQSSSTFAHGPQIENLPGAQKAYDSASLEVAKEQIAEKKENLICPENQVAEEEAGLNENGTDNVDSHKKMLSSVKPYDDVMVHREIDLNGENATDDVDMEINVDAAKKYSSIHTVMDFYNQASTSKHFFDSTSSINFDSDQFNFDPATAQEHNKSIWSSFVHLTQSLAAELTENLRMTLEPTIATKYQGDYRSGKRLNIRKLIPYIASYYRKNKIWLRRTKKAKRDYQIMLAIDDSSSMKDNRTKKLAFESLALLSNALRYLEAGQLAVCKFGDDVQLLHPFYDQFDDDRGASAISQLTFEQKQTNIVPLIDFCVNYFDQFAQHQTMSKDSDLPAQLMLVVSDGRGVFAQGIEKVRLAVQRATGRRIFMVFIVLDNPENKESIIDIKWPIFRESGPPEIRSYMEFFPFSFYVILRRINELPAILGDALRQWFEILSCQQN